MARPSFYNDNEYRAYPFIDQPVVFEQLQASNSRLPNDAIVDVSFILGLDAAYSDADHVVYLKQIADSGGRLAFKFDSTAPNCGDLIFYRDYESGALDNEWLSEYAESGVALAAAALCPKQPVWSGFLVTGKLETLTQLLEANGGVLNFASGTYVVEPARIQNLAKSYLRSISVGNYERTKIPACDAPDIVTNTDNIIWSAECLDGAIRFVEGYNTRITQTSRTNTLTFASSKGANAKTAEELEELCANSGEIPFSVLEAQNKPFIYNGNATKPGLRSKFLSGGWACKDLIFTINGVGGSNVNIIGGKNIQIGYDDTEGAITVDMVESAQGRCNG